MKRLRLLSRAAKTIVASAVLVSTTVIQMPPQCQALPSQSTDGDIRPFTCGQGVTAQFVDVGGSEAQFAFDGTGKVLQLSTSPGGGGNVAGCTISNFPPSSFQRIEVVFYDEDPPPSTGQFATLKFCLTDGTTNRRFSDRVSLIDLRPVPLSNNWYRAVGDPFTDRAFNRNTYDSDLGEISILLFSHDADAKTIKLGQVKLWTFQPDPLEPSNLIMSTAGCDAPNCPSALQTRLSSRLRDKLRRLRR